MFGIGALMKLVTRPADARRKIARLDAVISALEREAGEPVLEGLAEDDRFDCAIRLLDAAFLVRISEAGSRERREDLAERYLGQLEQEYRRAKVKLEKQPASRAEVVALSLALKEFAISLDGEIEAARSQHAEALRQLRAGFSDAESSLLTAVTGRQDAEFGRRADVVLKRVEAAAQSRVRALHEDVAVAVSGQTERLAETLRAELDRRIGEAATEARTTAAAWVRDTEERLSAGVTSQVSEAASQLGLRLDAAEVEGQRGLDALQVRLADTAAALRGEAGVAEKRTAAKLEQGVGELRDSIDRSVGEVRNEMLLLRDEHVRRVADLGQSVDERIAGVTRTQQEDRRVGAEQASALRDRQDAITRQQAEALERLRAEHALERTVDRAEAASNVEHLCELQALNREEILSVVGTLRHEHETLKTDFFAAIRTLRLWLYGYGVALGILLVLAF